MINLNIDGEPIAWKRPARNPKTNTVYDPQKLEKEQLRWYLRDKYREEPLTVPVKIEMTFFMPIPKGISGVKKREMLNSMIHHTKKPDIDNLSKFLLDVMTGVIYQDDSQVYKLNLEKTYSTRPGVSIEITPCSINSKRQQEVDNFYEGDTGE